MMGGQVAGQRGGGHRSPLSGLTQVVRPERGRNTARGSATAAVAALSIQNAIGYQMTQNSEDSAVRLKPPFQPEAQTGLQQIDRAQRECQTSPG